MRRHVPSPPPCCFHRKRHRPGLAGAAAADPGLGCRGHGPAGDEPDRDPHRLSVAPPPAAGDGAAQRRAPAGHAGLSAAVGLGAVARGQRPLAPRARDRAGAGHPVDGDGEPAQAGQPGQLPLGVERLRRHRRLHLALEPADRRRRHRRLFPGRARLVRTVVSGAVPALAVVARGRAAARPGLALAGRRAAGGRPGGGDADPARRPPAQPHPLDPGHLQRESRWRAGGWRGPGCAQTPFSARSRRSSRRTNPRTAAHRAAGRCRRGRRTGSPAARCRPRCRARRRPASAGSS